MDAARLRETLRRQGVYVHQDDPVLEVASICELAMAESLKAIEASNRAAADRITAASVQHLQAAREAAAMLVTEAGTWAAEHLRAAAAEIGTSIKKEVQVEANRVTRAASLSVRIAWSVAAFFAAAFAAVVGFWVAGTH